jgi:hypothetical protein
MAAVQLSTYHLGLSKRSAKPLANRSFNADNNAMHYCRLT